MQRLLSVSTVLIGALIIAGGCSRESSGGGGGGGRGGNVATGRTGGTDQVGATGAGASDGGVAGAHTTGGAGGSDGGIARANAAGGAQSFCVPSASGPPGGSSSCGWYVDQPVDEGRCMVAGECCRIVWNAWCLP